MNSGPGGQAAPRTGRPLAVTADWPVRCGVTPTLADRFNPRPETAPDLSRALRRSRTVALIPPADRAGTGLSQRWLGSCGKTQLAVAFAESQWQDRAIDLLMWVDGSSTASVLAGYVEAAQAVTGAETAGSAESAAASLIAWLGSTDARWLLVLDDVSDAIVLDGLVPAGSAGYVVITGPGSQAVAGLPDALVLEIGPFSSREAMTYLVGRLSKDPDQRRGAMDLIGDLGCHPMALAHSTGTIASSWITCADYREQFYRRQAQLAPPGNQAAAATTWTLALDRADQLAPTGAAYNCFALAAMLDGRGIPAGLFGTSAASEFIGSEQRAPDPPGQPGRPRQPAGRSQLALSSLAHVGLLSVDSQGPSAVVRVNPAMQQSAQAAMPAGMLAESAAAAAAALLEFWPQGDQRSPVAQMLRASAATLLRAAGDAIWADGCPDVLIQAGQSLQAAGMSAQALRYWRELGAASDRLLGAGHPDSLRLAGYLADACSALGLSADAIAARRRISDDRARVLGPQHSLTLAAQVDLGRSLVDAGDVSTASAVLAAALEESEPRRGASDPQVLGIRDELAVAYLSAGRTKDATQMLRTTLAQREQSGGPAHPDTIATRQKLAAASLAAGQLKEALSQYKRVVADSERTHGPDDRATLRARGALAAAYEQAGQIANAVSMYELARDGCERALGADDRDTLASCVSLARTYYAVGHLANATTLLRETVERCELVLPPNDPITRSARDSFAAIVGQ
jgi:tetratricopeptide (TPR) repeat protein